MKKILATIGAVVALLLAAIVVRSALLTSGNPEPMAVEGTWAYEITRSSSTGQGEMLSMNGRDRGTWEGAFEGTSTGTFTEQAGPSGRSYEGTESFEGSVVDEKGRRRPGTLEIQLTGERPDRESPWEGTWEITAGEGELANLQGKGTWSEVGILEVMFEGHVQFETKPSWRFW
jgi:hypothetical protein